MNKRNTGLLWMGLLVLGCGGRLAKQKEPTAEPSADATSKTSKLLAAQQTTDPLCARPIEAPGEVWKRVEAVRALSKEELVSSCGLSFVEVISEWRSPPADLLAPIVLNAAQNKEAFADWVQKEAKQGSKAAQHAVAMNILGDWKIGDDTNALLLRATPWKPLASQYESIATAVADTTSLQRILTSLKEIHELRCMLEVNPLGFAVSCTPIHPAKEKIDLTWKEEMRDGIIVSIALTKCKESPSCKKLKETSETFSAKYQAVLRQIGQLRTEIFKEQALEWMKLQPFSQTAP